MLINELLEKYKYITDISNYNGKIEVTILLNIKGIRHHILQDMTFNTIEDCDKYLEENYLQLKYELLEELVIEEQRKSMNQRKELHRLYKAYKEVDELWVINQQLKHLEYEKGEVAEKMEAVCNKISSLEDRKLDLENEVKGK